MKKIEIISSPNAQNEKIEDFISICGRSFRYSDNRGYSTFTFIDWVFALEIMDKLPAKVLHAERTLNVVDKNVDIKLSWSRYGLNKAQREAGDRESIEVKIHAGSEHLFTSEPIKL
jgi:hypothetical protein